MPEALLIDYGGVMTTDVFASFNAFCAAEGLPPETVRNLFLGEGRSLLFGLEDGSLPEPEFERALAPLLGVSPERLTARLFATVEPVEPMFAAVAAARRGGIRTGLISNSWGDASGYLTDRFDQLFDMLVISGEEGVRKPNPEIYALAIERLGVPPDQIVFVDDIGGNLKPARALGMTTVRHVDAATTIDELERLFRLGLR
jgi:epoxide hydrolase-like predicted phosphatase